MQIHDKLRFLRKKSGMTQSKLAESLNVSRQAISKWESGTARPDIENTISLGKLFCVSVDYLINDAMQSELDASVVKNITAKPKRNLCFIIIKIIIGLCIVLSAIVIGKGSNALATVMVGLVLIGDLALIYFVMRFLVTYFSNRR